MSKTPSKITIKKLSALEILDSRGVPTILVTVLLSDGVIASAAVPSGTSSGKFETVELRDGEVSRYGGKGVLKAAAVVEKLIFPKLKGKSILDQALIDQIMIDFDGTENKSRLGANSILAVSLACARAASISKKLPLYKYLSQYYKLPARTYRSFGTGGTTTNQKLFLPRPMFNLLNGGLHAESGMDIQEFMLVPNASSFAENVRFAAQTFTALKKLLQQRNLETNVGIEGGFAPKLRNSKEAIEILRDAAKAAGVPDGSINIALDVAASPLHDTAKDNRYVFKRERADFSREQLIAWYAELARSYPLISVEDGLDEDDWEGWTVLNQKLGQKIMIVGDDFIVTSPVRLKRAIEARAVNAVIIKPNQIGTLTETVECIKLAHENGVKTIISHRSGDTPDTFIADLAVGVGSEFIKSGSVSRGERVAKYNRLMEIEQELNSK